MPRKPRQLQDEGFYHLIARGNNGFFVFSVDGGFQRFEHLLCESKKKYPWKLTHYCLMANHIHLLGQVQKGEHLPKLMQYLLLEYSRWYRRKTGYVGHLWQGRYKSPLVHKESYFLEAGRYIERNPLRAGLVQNLKDYPWSSYPFYAYGENNPLLDEDPYYPQMGTNSYQRQEAYRDFVSLEHPYDKMLDEEFVEGHF